MFRNESTMNAKSAPLAGLRLTLRDQAIAVAFAALMCAVLANLLKGAGPDDYQTASRVLLLLSPWVLAGLFMLFERPGPIKDWLVACVLFAFYPALVLYHDVAVVHGIVLNGSAPKLAMTLTFNALILGSTGLFYHRMRPIPCPTCSRRTLIPLIRLMGQSRRIQKTRWCAACGGQFWRDLHGAWRIERRATWAYPSHHLESPAERAALCQPARTAMGQDEILTG
jgi:hypothetical protein